MHPSRSRQIAQTAVRDSLARATLDMVMRRGYDEVTLDDLAAETGVSRSTYLRHVGSKAEAVVTALMSVGDGIADRLRARPPSEGTWTALRKALDVIVEAHADASNRTLTLVKVLRTNPSLRAALAAERDTWRAALTAALQDRTPGMGALEAETFAAAALACLDVAVLAWSETSDHASVAQLLDRSFATLQSRVRA